jgi:hypothetical protein
LAIAEVDILAGHGRCGYRRMSHFVPPRFDPDWGASRVIDLRQHKALFMVEPRTPAAT